MSDFSDEFIHEILALLDRIELEEDHTLADQRHAIAEKHGMKVVFGVQASAETH